MNIAVANNRYTAALRAHERHSAAEITAAHSRLKQATAPVFATVIKQLAQAQKGQRELGLWWLYEQNRLQNVLDRVQSATSDYAASAATTIKQGRKHVMSIGSDAAIVQLAKRMHEIATPPPASQQGLEDAIDVQFDILPQETSDRVQDALMLAASLGITLAMLEQLLYRSVDRLLSFVIGVDVTIEYDAFRDTLGMWYQANSDSVQAWTWTTAEDERVCPFCESMDGSIHDLSESMESHPRCRCEMEPYFLDTSGSALAIGP
jgi:hypothetical protein